MLEEISHDHRAMAAVLHCFSHVVTEVREEALAPDFELFKTIITYMQDFPDRFHHPKEDRYLFPAVRKRAPDLAEVIDDLEAQHITGEKKLPDLNWKLTDWEASPSDPEKAGAFLDAAESYIEFQRKHAALEERTVIPEARKSLTNEDWEPINTALTDNHDPIFGARPEMVYQRLFSQIVRLAPQPWGTATRRAPEPPKDAQGNLDERLNKWSRVQREAVLRLHWI